jgi:hypothetical protein
MTADAAGKKETRTGIPDFTPRQPEAGNTPAFVYAGESFFVRPMSMSDRRDLMDRVQHNKLALVEDLLDAFLEPESMIRLEQIDEEQPISPEVLAEIATHLTREVFGAGGDGDPKPSGSSRSQKRTERRRTGG